MIGLDSLTLFRVLRTLKFFDRLQRYIMTLTKAVKSLGPIWGIMVPSMCIFATVACSIFGEILPVSPSLILFA